MTWKTKILPVNLRVLADVRLVGWIVTMVVSIGYFRSPTPLILALLLVALALVLPKVLGSGSSEGSRSSEAGDWN